LTIEGFAGVTVIDVKVGAPPIAVAENVARTALQFALPLRLYVAEKAPRDETTPCSVAARDPGLVLSLCSTTYPDPAVMLTVEVDGNPIPLNSSSPLARVCAVVPVDTAVPLPCALEVWSNGEVVLNPEYSKMASHG